MLSGCQPHVRKETVYVYTSDSLLVHPCKEDYREIPDPLTLAEMYINNTMCLRKYVENLEAIKLHKQQKEIHNKKN